MRRIKAVAVTILTMFFIMQGFPSFIPQAQAEAIFDASTLNYSNLLEGLGKSTDVGVLAEIITQRGHSEASIYTDNFKKLVFEPFLASGRGQAAISDYTLETDVYLPSAHPTVASMTFALYTKSGSSFQRYNGQSGDVTTCTLYNIAANTAKVTPSFEIKSNDAKRQELYILQLDNGNYVPNGEVNSSGFSVQYGDSSVIYPAPIISPGIDNYIGSMPDNNNLSTFDTIKIFQEQSADMELSGYKITFGSNIRLYVKVNNNYVLLDNTYTQDIRSNEIYIHDISWTGNNAYKKFAYVSYEYEQEDQCGYFFYNTGKKTRLDLTYSNENNSAAQELANLKFLSESLANIRELGIGGTSKGNPGTIPTGSGNSTVTGDIDASGRVVSLYAINTKNNNGSIEIDLNSLKTSSDRYETYDWNNGLPLATNEFAVINVICPSRAGVVKFIGGLSVITENGTKSSPNKWGSTDDNSKYMSHIIWNPVYLTNDGRYKSFEGTLEFNTSEIGGTILAPKAIIIVYSAANAVSLIAKSVENNGVEIHQTSFAKLLKQEDGAALTMSTVTGSFYFNKLADGCRHQGWRYRGRDCGYRQYP